MHGMSRAKSIEIRMSNEEYAQVQVRSKRKGLTISEYVRTLIRMESDKVYDDSGEELEHGFPNGMNANDFLYGRKPVVRTDGGLELYSKLADKRFVIYPEDDGYKALLKLV